MSIARVNSMIDHFRELRGEEEPSPEPKSMNLDEWEQAKKFAHLQAEVSGRVIAHGRGP